MTHYNAYCARYILSRITTPLLQDKTSSRPFTNVSSVRKSTIMTRVMQVNARDINGKGVTLDHFERLGSILQFKLQFVLHARVPHCPSIPRSPTDR